jgi:hypothetical protein
MTSVSSRIRQQDSDSGYYMPLSSLHGVIYSFTPGTGAGGSFAQGSFAIAGWAQSPNVLAHTNTAPNAAFGRGAYVSSINGVGAGLLKDMGRTVVSAQRTFRKIQLVAKNLSTSGVEGANPYQTSGTATNITDFLTGYIELGFEGAGAPAPVAKYGR